MMVVGLLGRTLWAHPGHGTQGFAAGLAHPLTGVDHIAAMMAVGLWAVQLGKRAVWMVPLAFVGMMVAGAGLAFAGVTLPFSEPGIAASVLVLGLLIVFALRMPVWAGMMLVGVFAVFHGWAHGNEMHAGTSAAGRWGCDRDGHAACDGCGVGDPAGADATAGPGAVGRRGADYLCGDVICGRAVIESPALLPLHSDRVGQGALTFSLVGGKTAVTHAEARSPLRLLTPTIPGENRAWGDGGGGSCVGVYQHVWRRAAGGGLRVHGGGGGSWSDGVFEFPEFDQGISKH